MDKCHSDTMAQVVPQSDNPGATRSTKYKPLYKDQTSMFFETLMQNQGLYVAFPLHMHIKPC